MSRTTDCIKPDKDFEATVRTLFVLHPFYRTITNKGGLDTYKGVKNISKSKNIGSKFPWIFEVIKARIFRWISDKGPCTSMNDRVFLWTNLDFFDMGKIALHLRGFLKLLFFLLLLRCDHNIEQIEVMFLNLLK